MNDQAWPLTIEATSTDAGIRWLKRAIWRSTLAWFDSRFGTAAWGLAMLDLAYYRNRLIEAYEARGAGV